MVKVVQAGIRTIKIDRSDQALHDAPVIFVDGAQTLIASDQLVKFNLYQDRLIGHAGEQPEVSLERVICARIVMTPAVFKQFVDWVKRTADDVLQTPEDQKG